MQSAEIGVKVATPPLTEHHYAPPLAKDPQVREAIALIEKTIQVCHGAINALEGGCKYNGNGTNPNDYFPNGIQDYIVRVFEPLLRLHVTKRFDQAVDVIGYVALFVAWMKMGGPDGQFTHLIKHLYPELTERQAESGPKQKKSG